MSKHQLYEVMVQMKMLIQQNQQQARQVLIANPQLTKALFQAQIMLGMVRPPQMSQVHPPMQVSQPQQQQGPTSNSPTILMQQPPLLPPTRPIAAHSSAVHGQPQRTTQLQQLSLQPMPAQQQLRAQPPFQQQGGMVQQGVAMAYPQQGLLPANRPLLQQQYQSRSEVSIRCSVCEGPWPGTCHLSWHELPTFYSNSDTNLPSRKTAIALDALLNHLKVNISLSPLYCVTASFCDLVIQNYDSLRSRHNSCNQWRICNF